MSGPHVLPANRGATESIRTQSNEPDQQLQETISRRSLFQPSAVEASDIIAVATNNIALRQLRPNTVTAVPGHISNAENLFPSVGYVIELEGSMVLSITTICATL